MATISNKYGRRESATSNSITFAIGATFTPDSESSTGYVGLEYRSGSGNVTVGSTSQSGIISETTVSTSNITHSGLSPNTGYQYYVSAILRVTATSEVIAFNTLGSVDTYTAAEAATLSVASVSATEITISWSTLADGGHRSKSIRYSLDGGSTWTEGASVTGGAASSGSFVISGLTPGTSYNIMTRTYNGVTTEGNTLSATTISSDPKFYGSVNSQTKEIKKLYGSVSDQTKLIRKLYGSVNGQTKLIYQA